MVVKLVSTDGIDLPFKGFMLVPEGRLILLEKVAAAARDLLTRHRDASTDVSKGFKIESAVKALGNTVGALEKVWDIPQ